MRMRGNVIFTTPALCIWGCGNSGIGAPPEHIMPVALGCPDNSVLVNGEVCRKCNHGLAPLDQALIDSFDLPRAAYNVPGKHGAVPRITSRRNLRTVTIDGVTAHAFNPGPGPLELPTGLVLPPPDGSVSSVYASVQGEGLSRSITFRAQGLHHAKLVRGLHKVTIVAIAH